MPKTYYICSGKLQSHYKVVAAYPRIEHIPKEIVDSLFEHSIYVDSKEMRDFWINTEFPVHSCELPNHPRFYTNAVTELRLSYQITTNLQDAVKIVESACAFEIRSHMPIFEIEVPDDEEVDQKHLSDSSKKSSQSTSSWVVEHKKLPFSQKNFTVKNVYIQGYYNINGDKYEILSLDRKTQDYRYGKYETLLIASTALFIIPLIIYGIYRLFEWSKKERAKSLIKQADAYLSHEGKLFVKKPSEEKSAFKEKTISTVEIPGATHSSTTSVTTTNPSPLATVAPSTPKPSFSPMLYQVKCDENDEQYNVQILEMNEKALLDALEKFGDSFCKKMGEIIQKHQINIVMLRLENLDSNKQAILKQFMGELRRNYGFSTQHGNENNSNIVTYKLWLPASGSDFSDKRDYYDGAYERNNNSEPFSLSYLLYDKQQGRKEALKKCLERETSVPILPNKGNRSGKHMVIVAPYLTDNPGKEEMANPGTYGVFYKQSGQPAEMAKKIEGVPINLEERNQQQLKPF